MGEIRIVSPGKTRGYPYPVCKKTRVDNNVFDYFNGLLRNDSQCAPRLQVA